MVFNLFKLLNFGPLSSYKTAKVSSQTMSMVISEWVNINILLKQGSPSQLRQAVIAADKTLDNCLRDLVAGESMGERLKNAKDIFERSLYDKIWSAHKIRNSLVHESGYEPAHYMLRGAIDTFKIALLKLNVKV